MASTGIDTGHGPERTMSGKEKVEKEYNLDETPIAYGVKDDEANPAYESTERLIQDSTHRKLKPRHIQLIGIGGYAISQTTSPAILQRLTSFQDNRHGSLRSNWPGTSPWRSRVAFHGFHDLVSSALPFPSLR